MFGPFSFARIVTFGMVSLEQVADLLKAATGPREDRRTERTNVFLTSLGLREVPNDDPAPVTGQLPVARGFDPPAARGSEEGTRGHVQLGQDLQTPDRGH